MPSRIALLVWPCLVAALTSAAGLRLANTARRMFPTLGVWMSQAPPELANAPLALKALRGQLLCEVDGSDIIVMNRTDQLCRLRGHTAAITCLALDRSKGMLFSGSVDCTVRKWDLQSLQLNATLRSHSKMVTCLAACEHEDVLVSGSADGTLVKWNASTCEVVATMRGHDLIVTSLAVDENESAIFSGSGDKTVRKWDLATGALRLTLRGHKLPVTCVTVDLDTQTVYSGEYGGHTVHSWDIRTGHLIGIQAGPIPNVSVIVL